MASGSQALLERDLINLESHRQWLWASAPVRQCLALSMSMASAGDLGDLGAALTLMNRRSWFSYQSVFAG